MSLSAKQTKQIEKIIATATELLKSANAAKVTASEKSSGPRRRRAGKELNAFRKMLAVERANGASVADLAKAHGVSSAYIYQLPASKKATSKKAVRKKSAVRKSAA